jgi:hypothetical protein
VKEREMEEMAKVKVKGKMNWMVMEQGREKGKEMEMNSVLEN